MNYDDTQTIFVEIGEDVYSDLTHDRDCMRALWNEWCESRGPEVLRKVAAPDLSRKYGFTRQPYTDAGKVIVDAFDDFVIGRSDEITARLMAHPEQLRAFYARLDEEAAERQWEERTGARQEAA